MENTPHDGARIKHDRSTSRGRSTMHGRESRTHGGYLHASNIPTSVPCLCINGDRGGGVGRDHRRVRRSWGIRSGYLADEP